MGKVYCPGTLFNTIQFCDQKERVEYKYWFIYLSFLVLEKSNCVCLSFLIAKLCMYIFMYVYTC